jgi:hypothetical protein
VFNCGKREGTEILACEDWNSEGCGQEVKVVKRILYKIEIDVTARDVKKKAIQRKCVHTKERK